MRDESGRKMMDVRRPEGDLKTRKARRRLEAERRLEGGWKEAKRRPERGQKEARRRPEGGQKEPRRRPEGGWKEA